MKNLNINSKKILNIIANYKQISRAEISRMLKIEKSTTSYLVDNLIKNNIVCYGNEIQSPLGRNAKEVIVNPDCFDNIVINLGETKMTFYVTNSIGEVKKKYEDIPIYKDNIILEKVIFAECELLVKQFKNIKNIMIGFHGMVNLEEDFSFSPFYTINIKALVSDLISELNVNCYVENEANLLTLGLYDKTLNKTFLGIHINSGIGAGIVQDSKILTGQNGFAGEFGHQIIYIDGLKCNCGNNGCIEKYCSETSLLKKMSTYLGYEISQQQFIEFIETENDDITKIIKETIKELSVGINNILLILDTGTLYISSELYSQIPYFKEELISNLHSKNISLNEIIIDAFSEENFIKGSCKKIFMLYFKL
ncbi:MAG: ROK family transcriptional regulator [Mycoplasmatales bacterium]